MVYKSTSGIPTLVPGVISSTYYVLVEAAVVGAIN